MFSHKRNISQGDKKENNWLWKQTPSETVWALSGAAWERDWGKGTGEEENRAGWNNKCSVYDNYPRFNPRFQPSIHFL